MTSIIGAGLKDKEITQAFTKMKNHKLNSQKIYKSFPLSTANLRTELDEYDSTQEIIHYSIMIL